MALPRYPYSGKADAQKEANYQLYLLGLDNFVSQGFTLGTATGLTQPIDAGIAFLGGQQVGDGSTAPSDATLIASETNKVYLARSTADIVVQDSVTAAPANSVLLWTITTNASAITGTTDERSLQLTLTKGADLSGDVWFPGPQTDRGIYWGRDTGQLGYIRQAGGAEGQLEIGSDDVIRFTETDGDTDTFTMSLNNTTFYPSTANTGGVGTAANSWASMYSNNYYLDDANTRLHQGSGDSLRIETPNGYGDFGAQNASWFHIQTDLPAFFFNKEVAVDGNLRPYTDSTRDLGTTGLRWLNIYGDTIYATDRVGIGTTAVSNGILTINGSGTSHVRLENDANDGEAYARFRSKDAVGNTLHADIALRTTASDQGYLGVKVPHDNTAGNGHKFKFHHTGQLDIPTVGSGAGILIGGDTQLYRSSANLLRTPDALQADGYINTLADYKVDGTTIINQDGNIQAHDTRAVEMATDLGLAGVRWDFKSNTTDGLSDGGTYHGVMTFQPYSDSSGGYTHNLGFTQDGGVYYRRAAIGGTWGSWRQMWDSGNDGTGSGLDADLLDGLDSTQFLRSDATDTFTGGYIQMDGDAYHIYGPNTGYSQYLKVGGVETSIYASVVTTEGNLHLDPKAGKALYLNFYDGAAIYFGNGANGIRGRFDSGGLRPDVDNTYDLGSPTYRWNAVHGTYFHGDGANLTNVDAETLDGYDWSDYAPISSGSDFADGTFVRTSIDATPTNGDSFVMEVTGKSYTSVNPPFSFILQGYIYNDTFLATSGINLSGYGPSTIKVFEDGGDLCFWWDRISYWNNFNVTVRKANSDNKNYATGISNSVEPTPTKTVTVTMEKAWTTDNHGSGSGLDADLLDGVQLAGTGTGGTTWDIVPRVKSDGVMEIGRIIDFHNTSGDAGDYAVRLDSLGTDTLDIKGVSATGLKAAGSTVWTAANDGPGSGLNADLLDGKDSTEFAFREQTSFTLPATAGWYRIARNGTVADGAGDGNRATGRFVVTNTNSGDHQSIHFHAAVHYGADPTITLQSNSKYSGSDIVTDIRVVHGGTYEGAAVEIYLADTSAPNWSVDLYEDDQVAGWTLVGGTAGAVPTGFTATVMDVSNTILGAAADERERMALYRDGDLRLNDYTTLSPETDGSLRVQGASGYIDIGPKNSGYCHIYTDRPEFYFNKELRVNNNKVWHAGNDGAGSGLDADLLDGQHGSYYTDGDNITGVGLWNADGNGNVFVYDDANPTYNSKLVGAVIDIQGDGVQDNAIVRSGMFHAHHHQASNGFYVGAPETNGTQVVDSSANLHPAAFVEFDEVSTPATPAANDIRLYAKDVGGVSKLFTIDSTGVETEVGSGAGGGGNAFLLMGA